MATHDAHWATDDARWRAVLDRDAAADGAFVYGVRSTGVYCRPTCPARRPRRTQVVFFATPAAAERAGYRACRRCRPAAPDRAAEVVSRMRALLETEGAAPTLAQLAAAVGLSPAYAQRLFKRLTGLSPRQYVAVRRREQLKQQLRQGAPVAESVYASGYGSSRAAYESARERLGMTPGAYRRGGQGVRIAYRFTETALGTALIAVTATGVCACRFGNKEHLLSELRSEFPRAELTEDQAAVATYAAWLNRLLSGERPQPGDLPPVDIVATEFQLQVWQALRAIPCGETRTYAEIAAAIGRPRAVRAVAGACAANPVAVMIPCHRVIRSDGDLSGYRWGVDRKRALLATERRQ
ncbi:MAG: bifunctional DNA-binding transcriptional regulator/O6-methylguanine-DNA methyltransferase Ada [Chloroflexota bacterium]